MTFRTRVTLALIAAAVLPIGVFGAALVLASRRPDAESTVPSLLLLAIVMTALIALLVAYILAARLAGTFRAISAAVDRVNAGDMSTPLVVPGDDELARLAESHNRLAQDVERRNAQLNRVLSGMLHAAPHERLEVRVESAAKSARDAFGLIDAQILLTDAPLTPMAEDIPGDPRPVRAELRVGDERIGVLVGRLPATASWARADQNLLDVFASAVGVSIRNAQLFARVEAQNGQLVELNAAKDDFLRGVSHNLQTPLTSIRTYADQLNVEHPDRRLDVIGDQSQRASRMVRQLLMVNRLESGTVRSTPEVFALGMRVRRTWESMAVEDVPFQLDDRSPGWLAVADPDQLDQVLWALLDNAVKYGQRGLVGVQIEVASETSDGDSLRMTVADQGPGVLEADRSRLFERFARGTALNSVDGTGLGLYVARALCRAMGGDLILEPSTPGHGAEFSVLLPAEVALE